MQGSQGWPHATQIYRFVSIIKWQNEKGWILTCWTKSDVRCARCWRGCLHLQSPAVFWVLEETFLQPSRWENYSDRVKSPKCDINKTSPQNPHTNHFLLVYTGEALNQWFTPALRGDRRAERRPLTGLQIIHSCSQKERETERGGEEAARRWPSIRQIPTQGPESAPLQLHLQILWKAKLSHVFKC